MFSQSAFIDPSIAIQEYIAYLEGLQINQNWPSNVVDSLIEQANNIFTDTVNWWTPSQQETDSIWSKIAAQAPQLITSLVNPPTQLNNYDSFRAVIGAGQLTAAAQQQATGVTGVINLAQDQLEDVAKDINEKNKTLLNPFFIAGVGLTALYLVSR